MLSLTGYDFILRPGVTDFRNQQNGLSGIVRNELKQDPMKEGVMFIFFNGRRNQVKMLTWEGDGFGMYYKRLSIGTFAEPIYDITSGTATMTRKDLSLILDGIDITYRKRYVKKQK